MSELKLDASNDLALTDFNFVIIDGEENVAQRVKTNLQVFLGEWFLDTTRGVPYYQTILLKNPDSLLVEFELKKTITDTDSIARLKEFTMDFNNSLRELTVTFTAQTDEGLELALQVVI